MSDLSQGFALFVTLAKRLNRIAKGDDNKDLDRIGNSKYWLYLLKVVQAYLVGTDDLGPGGESHALTLEACQIRETSAWLAGSNKRKQSVIHAC